MRYVAKSRIDVDLGEHRMRTGIAAVAALAVLASVGAGAPGHPTSFTPIDQPTDDYRAATCLVAIPGAEGDTVSSMGACGNLVSFGQRPFPVVRDVPADGWHLWGQPPFVENPTPRILTTTRDEQVRVRFRRDMTVGGIEIEPSGHRTMLITASFYAVEDPLGDPPLGTITRRVSGHGGALLFAATVDPPFHSIVVTTSKPINIGVGDFRVTPHVR